MLIRHRAAVLSFGLASASGFYSPVARAQDLAAAQVLFDRGLADMNAKKFDTACPALRESHRIDPRPGTLFTVAECEAGAGLHASAFAHYEDYLQLFQRMTQQDQAKQMSLGRDRISREQKQRLAPLVPYLTVVLSPDAPKGTKVLRDKLELSDASLGLALPIDPGDHVLTVQPPGSPSFEIKLTLTDGQKKTIPVEVPSAQPSPLVTASVSASAKASSVAAPVPIPTGSYPPPGGSWSTAKTGALIAAGVGLTGIVVGSVAGGIAVGQKDVIASHCSADFVCDAEGFAAAESSRPTGIVSTVGFGVGLAGLAAAAVLWLVAPASPKPGAATPKATIAAGLSMSGKDGGFAIVRGQW